MSNRAYLSCFPFSLNYLQLKDGFRSIPEHPQSGLIGIAQSGSGILFRGSDRTPLKEGCFFILYPDEENVELMAAKGDILKLAIIIFRVASVHGSATRDCRLAELIGGGTVFRAASALTDSLVSQLRQALADRGEIGSLRAQLALLELLMHFHAHQQASSKTGSETIHATIEYMEQRLSKPLQISELHALAGMTPSSYNRAFKRLTGLTPGHYLTRLRMVKAKELMTDSSAALRDIAVSVGYQDELYFSRVFKKSEGVSPSVYLKRRDRRIAVVSSYFLQDHLLALGILPIAAPSYPQYFQTAAGFPSYLQDRLTGAVPLNAEQPIRSSDVMRLAPDLVLRTKQLHDPADNHWGENDSAILIDHSTSWEQYFRTIAAKVDRKPEAERIIRSMTKLEQEARRKLASAAKQGKWTILRLLPGNCRLYGVKEHSFTELFYNRLQFQPDERITHGTYIDDAFELVAELDPERLLIIWSADSVMDEFAANPKWQNLRAVKENQVYCPESKEWDPWGPIGRAYMIKSMIRFFGKL